MSNSPIPSSSSPTPTPTHRHALTAVEKQRSQLERLLKDPAKPAFVPAPPKEKAIRPAREMMKNVQGSSAGAGSGEFHVYKASRRREYERLKLMEDQSAQVSGRGPEFCMFGPEGLIRCVNLTGSGGGGVRGEEAGMGGGC